MQKYVLVKLLEPAPQDGIFHMKDWPLHVTVAPRFAVDMKESELLESVCETIDDATPAGAVAAEDEFFGEKQDLRATILNMSPELKSLHIQLHNQLVCRGAIFDEPQYCGENYRAHATVQKSGRLQRGEKVLIDELALVDMFHNEDIRQRRIVEQISLKSTI